MNLRNPFSDKVRVAFIDYWECYFCQKNYPLELHHIKGRESNSALNASVLCNECHSHIGHTEYEEQVLMLRTVKFLVNNNYKFDEIDLEFYAKYKYIYDKVERE